MDPMESRASPERSSKTPTILPSDDLYLPLPTFVTRETRNILWPTKFSDTTGSIPLRLAKSSLSRAQYWHWKVMYRSN